MISRLQKVWDYEYAEAQVIPSSTRGAPSQALLLFSELLGFRNMKRALDAGCGNGRNSLYLACLGLQVVALDFSPVALAEVRKRASKADLLDKITEHEHNLEVQLPFEPESFDLCLDFYVFCHFLNEQLKRHYVAELWRVTKPGGYTLSALFSPCDEYYRGFVTTGGEPIIVKDPANGIVKQLYTKENFKKWFVPPFEIRYFAEFEFDDVVQGKSYHRNILAMALQRPKDITGRA